MLWVFFWLTVPGSLPLFSVRTLVAVHFIIGLYFLPWTLFPLPPSSFSPVYPICLSFWFTIVPSLHHWISSCMFTGDAAQAGHRESPLQSPWAEDTPWYTLSTCLQRRCSCLLEGMWELLVHRPWHSDRGRVQMVDMRIFFPAHPFSSRALCPLTQNGNLGGSAETLRNNWFLLKVSNSFWFT